MTITQDIYAVNITSVSSAATGKIPYLTMAEGKNTKSDLLVYPFTIDGYVGTLNIVDSVLKSFTVFSGKAKDRLSKLSKYTLVENLNKNKDIGTHNCILFNVQTGELIGSLANSKLFSQHFRINEPSYRDSIQDEYLIYTGHSFMRTSRMYGAQFVIKQKVRNEIFEAPSISEYLLGLFFELEELSIPEYTTLDEILAIAIPGKLNVDLFEDKFGDDINKIINR